MSAQNEQLKIKANFWNGLAIASAAAGVILPVFGAYASDEIWNATVFPVLSKLAYRTLLPMAVGAFFAFIFHMVANTYASQISDD
jgi:hypothetical protein